MATRIRFLKQRIFANLISYHVKSVNQSENLNLQKTTKNQTKYFTTTD